MACARPQFRTVLFLLSAPWLIAGLSGCTYARSHGSSSATAPGLQGDGPMRTGHNVADPNAPFTLMPSSARLAKRETLLDISDAPLCAPAALSFFESRSQASGMHHTVRFTVTNSGEACRLGGFPSITLLEADGRVLGDIHVRKVSEQSMAATLTPPSAVASQTVAAADEPSPQILLSTHDAAAFQLGWTAGANCEQVVRIAIAAPGTTQTIVIPRMLAVCEDQVLLTAVSPSNEE